MLQKSLGGVFIVAGEKNAKLERIIRTSDGFADFEETHVEDPVTGAITVKFAIWTTDKSVFDRFTAP